MSAPGQPSQPATPVYAWPEAGSPDMMKDLHFFMEVRKWTPISGDNVGKTDWAKVAEAMGLKNKDSATVRQGQIFRKYGFVRDPAVVVQYRKYGRGETPIVKPSLSTPNNDFTNAVLPPGTAPAPGASSTGRKRGAPVAASSAQQRTKKPRVPAGSAQATGPVAAAPGLAQTPGIDPFSVGNNPLGAGGAAAGVARHGYGNFQPPGITAPAPSPYGGHGYGQGARPSPQNPRARQLIDPTEDDEDEDEDHYPTAGPSVRNASHRPYDLQQPAMPYGNMIRGPVYGGSPATYGFPGQTASSFSPPRYPTHGQQHRLPGASLWRDESQPMRPVVQGADLATPYGYSAYDQQQQIGEEDNLFNDIPHHPSAPEPLPAPVADFQAAGVQSEDPQSDSPQSGDHQNAEFHTADHQSGEFNAEAF